ncbi:MAG: hypothetical protein ACP5JG_04105 [Anaerolineae bacterium]
MLQDAEDREDYALSVRENGPHTVVFPINGTRRWFALSEGDRTGDDYRTRYPEIVARELRRLIGLFFDNGVRTLVVPVYGGDLIERGAEYREMAEVGIRLLCGQEARALYSESAVRVRFYGEYADQLSDEMLSEMECLIRDTAGNEEHRLFYGVCGDTAVPAIARAVLEAGRLISHEEAIRAFYGEDLMADLFIGFDQPTAFDMPLIDRGGVDLYFTAAPSLYMDEKLLRMIFFDWQKVRRENAAYDTLRVHHWEYMDHFYTLNRHAVMGLGRRKDGIWYPVCDIKEADT